ncbi:MAG TPA: MBL fold metallo-hydrolase [Gemmatimonadaceae bacterium]|nr:MBL fold metallo-hydrolase [Gemmatimonadaceae bacterium]
MTVVVQLLTLAGLVLAAQQPPYETTRVAEGVYRFRWQGHNAMFVVTPRGVVACDPISAQAAATYASEIRRVAPGVPLAAIVYSHSDADHATGAPALMAGMGQQNVPIIAHEAAVAPIRRAASADLPVPTMTFAERLVLDHLGRRIELHYLGRSHTDNMIVPFVPDAGIIFAVDFVSNDRVAYQQMPGWYFPDIFDALTGVLNLPFTTVVFGHGADGNRATIQLQFAYYDDLRAAVRRAIAQGLTEEQAAAQIRLDAYAGWGQYEAWFPLNVRGMYRALTAAGR